MKTFHIYFNVSLAILCLCLFSCDEDQDIVQDLEGDSIACINNCTFISPEDDEYYNIGEIVTIKLEIEGVFERFNLLIDDQLVDTNLYLPYIYYWNTEETNLGEHLITAKLFDNDGGVWGDAIWISILPPNDNTGESTVTDIEGNTYKTVKIGDQWWMAENLKVKHLTDGSEIEFDPSTRTGLQKSIEVFSSEAVYSVLKNINDDDLFAPYTATEFQPYTVIYNYEAAKNACPLGWHLPTDDEWKKLEMRIGMDEETANSLEWRSVFGEGVSLKALNYWYNDDNGDDIYGFNALPGSYDSEGWFWNYGTYEEGCWWTSTVYEYFDASYFTVLMRSLSYEEIGIRRFPLTGTAMVTVRCVKDTIIE